MLTEPAAEPDLDRANYVAADDPVQGEGALAAAFAAATPEEIEQAQAVMAGGNGAAVGVTNQFDDGETQAPIIKSDREKTGRNDPCWCGSGKKFKFCHGAN